MIKESALIFITILFSLISYHASASSCKPLNDRIIAQCKGLICEEIIFISDVKSFGSCKRRPIVIDPPQWAKSVIEYEVKTNDLTNVGAIYELVISTRYYLQAKDFRNAQEYIELVEENGGRSRFFNKYRKFQKLNKTSFESIKKQWESKQRDKHFSDILRRLVDWASLIVGSVFLVFSIHWFNQWVNGAKTIKWLLLSFIIQSIIIYLAFNTVFGLSNSRIIMIAIFVPGIWLSQVIIFLSSRLKCKN